MPPKSYPLAVNLSFIGKKPTGLANYALNLIPELPLSGLTLLALLISPHSNSIPTIPFPQRSLQNKAN
ncbi:MAG: hypothetical protein HC781_16795 [Leptolyngbyaceae cyanobacterium CSU_1_4]|nr:hypothetical protein [Leptolyngbyaceae cyanobacterium CSU_1_4]